MSEAFTQLLSSITPAVYDNFKRAVELGKWPDGRQVTPEQRQLCMAAIIAYEHRHLPQEQRSGYVPPKDSGECTPRAAPSAQILKWKIPTHNGV